MTPTTDEMRGIFIGHQIETRIDADVVEESQAFDTWLAAHDAEVREQAAQEIEAEAFRYAGDFEGGLFYAAAIVRGV